MGDFFTFQLGKHTDAGMQTGGQDFTVASTILRFFSPGRHWQHKVQQCHFLFKLLFYLHTERLQRPQHLQGQGSEWKTRVWQWEAHTKLVWAINPRKCC